MTTLNLKTKILKHHKVNALTVNLLSQELDMSPTNPFLLQAIKEIAEDESVVRGDDLVDIVESNGGEI